MTRINLFNSAVSINEVSKAIALLRSVATAFNLGITGADVALFDLSKGELLGNVGKLTNRCNGLSIWATDKDFGVRVTDTFYKSLGHVQQFALDNCYGYKLKKRDNERRYSFGNALDLVQFLSTLSAYKSETKELVTVESVSA